MIAKKLRYKRGKFELNAGDSEICPFLPGETFEQRHQRRVRTNFAYEGEMQKWCNGRRINFHRRRSTWIFKRGFATASWNIAQANLIVRATVGDKTYTHSVHVHDYKQAIKHLQNLFI